MPESMTAQSPTKPGSPGAQSVLDTFNNWNSLTTTLIFEQHVQICFTHIPLSQAILTPRPHPIAFQVPLYPYPGIDPLSLLFGLLQQIISILIYLLRP